MNCPEYDPKLRRICRCLRKAQPQIFFESNIKDVTNALAEILTLFGIHECKVSAAKDVIKDCFRHYDKIRHDVVTEHEQQGICKSHLVRDLGCKCLMTEMEAELTYAVMKRAFKAFYHGVPSRRLTNPIDEARFILDQEPWWMHAARRTVNIFRDYEDKALLSAENYEKKIKDIYRGLYDGLKKRVVDMKIPFCECPQCTRHHKIRTDYDFEAKKSEAARRAKPRKPCADVTLVDDDEQQVVSRLAPRDKLPERVKHKACNEDLKLPRCFQCNCPLLLCDCNVNPDTGFLQEDCGQGPFKCFWSLTSKGSRADRCAKEPQFHQCPVDCDEISFDYDELDELECICGEDCECFDDDEDASSDYSSEGIEDWSHGESEEDPNTDLELDPRVVDKYEICRQPSSSSSTNWHKCKPPVVSRKQLEPEPSGMLLPRIPCNLPRDQKSDTSLSLSIDCFPLSALDGSEEQDLSLDGLYDQGSLEGLRSVGSTSTKKGSDEDGDGVGDGDDRNKDGKDKGAKDTRRKRPGRKGGKGGGKLPSISLSRLNLPTKSLHHISTVSETETDDKDKDKDKSVGFSGLESAEGSSEDLKEHDEGDAQPDSTADGTGPPSRRRQTKKKTAKPPPKKKPTKPLPCCPPKPSRCFKKVKDWPCSECH